MKHHSRDIKRSMSRRTKETAMKSANRMHFLENTISRKLEAAGTARAIRSDCACMLALNLSKSSDLIILRIGNGFLNGRKRLRTKAARKPHCIGNRRSRPAVTQFPVSRILCHAFYGLCYMSPAFHPACIQALRPSSFPGKIRVEVLYDVNGSDEDAHRSLRHLQARERIAASSLRSALPLHSMRK